MGNLHVDPLAIAALIGFGTLLLISAGLVGFLIVKAGKSAGEK